MFKVFVKYPSYDEEYLIAESTTADREVQVETVLNGEDILRLQHLVRRVPTAEHVIHYALRFVRATRVTEKNCPAFVTDALSWGAGPRGVQYLLLGGKARAVLEGRTYTTTDDIRAVVRPVLRHRLITNFDAESSGIQSDDVINRLLDELPDRSEGDMVAPELAQAFS